MNTEDRLQTGTVSRQSIARSYFEWGNGMQVVRRGTGDVAMTEGELARFFGVTWRKVNGRLRTITEGSVLHPEERGTMEVLLVSPIRPLLIIVAKVVPYLVLAFVILIAILLMA
ncbi:MAG: hypothetical protein ACFNLG_08165, partial [Prevotella nigrescens]|uniref:hypothetical protein n=1 Tax=Prevotella nigrescens TaxID=28133 RepID=UPI00360F8710